MEQLKVSLENIIPLTYARDHFSQIVSEVQKDKLFVLTKGGKPAVAIVDVKYLEQVTGSQIQKKDIEKEIKKAPEKVGLAPMVEHKKPTPPPPPKPAGFAAPQPPKPPSPLKPPEPKPATPPKPEAAGFATPAPKPPTPPKPAPPPPAPPPKPSTPTPLPSPPLPRQPLKTPAMEGDKGRVDVQFAPDETALKKKAQDGKFPDNIKIDPDVKPTPAQYQGTTDKEPEDMALD